jgi:recombination associated protein RdgC
MSWQDRVNFMLSHDFSLSSIQFQDELVAEAKDRESESRRQQFDVDFLIMTEAFTGLLKDLTALLIKPAGLVETNEREMAVV